MKNSIKTISAGNVSFPVMSTVLPVVPFPVTYPFVYRLEMEFTNPSAPLFSDPSVAPVVRRETRHVNAYYLSAPSARVKNRKYLTIQINRNRLVVDVYCQKKLTPGREGNALRQFSRFLVAGGLSFCLTKTNPAKLLQSV